MKIHWRSPSKIEWTEQALAKFVSAYADQGIAEISFPQLGCGNGNLDWADVRPLMEHYLEKVTIAVYIHDYAVDAGLPEHLAPTARALRDARVSSRRFDSFLASLGKALTVSNGELTTLDAQSTFRACLRDDNGLAIETETSSYIFEEDDLRGGWFDMRAGLVTRENAGWSIKRGAEQSLCSRCSVCFLVCGRCNSSVQADLNLNSRPSQGPTCAAPSRQIKQSSNGNSHGAEPSFCRPAYRALAYRALAKSTF